MKPLCRISILITLLVCYAGSLYAQPETILINNSAKFKNKRRAPVMFNHEAHMETAECLDCHHRYEDGENVMEEDELEEGNPDVLCGSCHNVNSTCELQETYHGQCMGCHIKGRKTGESAGPRMCNGCHNPDQPLEAQQDARVALIDATCD